MGNNEDGERLRHLADSRVRQADRGGQRKDPASGTATRG